MFKFMITLPLCFTMGTQHMGGRHSFTLQIICLCFLSSPQHTPKNPADNQMLMLQQHLERLCKTFPFWHKYLSCVPWREMMTSLTIGSLQECQSCNCRYFGFLDRCRSGWCQPKVWSTDLVLLKDLHSPWRRDDLNNREALSNYLQKWCESCMDLFSSRDISISIVEFHENFKFLHIPVLLLVAHMPFEFSVNWVCNFSAWLISVHFRN